MSQKCRRCGMPMPDGWSVYHDGPDECLALVMAQADALAVENKLHQENIDRLTGLMSWRSELVPLAKALIEIVEEYCRDNYEENEDDPMRDACLALAAAIKKLEE